MGRSKGIHAKHAFHFCIVILDLLGGIGGDISYLFPFFHRRILSQNINVLPIRIGTFDVIFMNKESNQQAGTCQTDGQAEQRDEEI
jgi:hypothetical protein